jgi:hypothetical protein
MYVYMFMYHLYIHECMKFALFIWIIYLGGAVDLVTACDLRYCTDSSAFCIKETDLAMVADVGIKHIYYCLYNDVLMCI